MEKIDGMSRDLELEAREKLKSVFPDCFAEGKLDIDKLLNICGEYIDDDFEKYEFKWKGKNDCLKLAQRRSAGTLRPCREESVDWENTENLYIEGDNLEVLKILQSSYYRKVKMIYIDPPYNTGNDFVYEDDYKDPIERYKEVTSQTTKSNPETMGRFHTNWLNMMYPRLRLAANLLRDDGVIFISIDDNELHNLRKVCDEVFGEENFYTQIIVQSNKRGQTYKQISKTHEYLLVYTKHMETEFNELEKSDENDDLNLIDDIGKFNIRELRNRNPKFGSHNRPNLFYPIYVNPTVVDMNGFSPISILKSEAYSIKILPFNSSGQESCWRWGKSKIEINNNKSTMLSNVVAKKKADGNYNIYEKYRKSTYKPKTIWNDVSVITEKGTVELGEIGLSAYFDFPKPIELIKRMMQIGTNSDDLILDFFSGSATTAHAVMQLNAEDGGNRRYICVQLPELCGEKSEAYRAGYKNICEIGKERIRRAGNKILAEWKEKQSQMENGENESTVPPDVGFKVFKLDTSNISAWDGYAVRNEGKEGLQKRIDEFLEGVKPGRTRLDVVYEIILKTGFPLTAKVETIDINGREVYSIDNETILICLFENVGFEDVEEMAQYAPAHIVFGEKCFADTSAVKNAKEALRDTGIDIKFF
ncbi:DNA methyltransferase [Anaerotignum faecicola]|nr:DNA methyltransferase [Anaerotignum faecicola]